MGDSHQRCHLQLQALLDCCSHFPLATSNLDHVPCVFKAVRDATHTSGTEGLI